MAEPTLETLYVPGYCCTWEGRAKAAARSQEAAIAKVRKSLARLDRSTLEAVAEAAIRILDERQGDVDLEDGGDDEHSEGWSHNLDAPDEVLVRGRRGDWSPTGDALSPSDNGRPA
jgi:hypothetical protein